MFSDWQIEGYIKDQSLHGCNVTSSQLRGREEATCSIQGSTITASHKTVQCNTDVGLSTEFVPTLRDAQTAFSNPQVSLVQLIVWNRHFPTSQKFSFSTCTSLFFLFFIMNLNVQPLGTEKMMQGGYWQSSILLEWYWLVKVKEKNSTWQWWRLWSLLCALHSHQFILGRHCQTIQKQTPRAKSKIVSKRPYLHAVKE